jgi:hypothetical protein
LVLIATFILGSLLLTTMGSHQLLIIAAGSQYAMVNLVLVAPAATPLAIPYGAVMLEEVM